MNMRSRATINGALFFVGLCLLVVLLVISQQVYSDFRVVADDQMCSSCGDIKFQDAIDMVKQILALSTTTAVALFGGLVFVAIKTPQYANSPMLYAVQRTLHLVAALSLLTTLHYCFVLSHVLSVRFVDKIAFIGSRAYNSLVEWIYYPTLIAFLALLISILLMSFDIAPVETPKSPLQDDTFHD